MAGIDPAAPESGQAGNLRQPPFAAKIVAISASDPLADIQ